MTDPATTTARPGGVQVGVGARVLHEAPGASVVLAPGVLPWMRLDRILRPAPSLPLDGTLDGHLLRDRSDDGLRWYLPGYALADPDPGFAFAAAQVSVDASGNPFDQATLTVDLDPVDPPDVAQARTQPGLRLAPVPVVAMEAALSLPFTDPGGHPSATVVTGRVEPQDGGRLKLVFDGLLGPAVILAYQQLLLVGGAAVSVRLTYQVWQPVLEPGPRPWFPPRPLPVDRLPSLLATGPMIPQPLPRGPVIERPPTGPPPVDPGPGGPRPRGVTTTAQAEVVVQLGQAYATGPYRSAYTLTAGNVTRPIIDAGDLRDFQVARSEFRELTSLGDVQARYPSIERLYVGQVTGTVVAVPAAYGIARGTTGCAARLDAVIDDSPSSTSGCRFHFTFELAPAVDPVDLAQLGHDLLSVPEAAHLSLRLTLPTALDPRVQGTLQGPGGLTSAYADGPDDHSVLLAVDIADDGATPAVSSVNLFLGQLCAPVSTPLFGHVGVRLDDVHEPAVMAAVVLNLHTTSGGDDLAVTDDDSAVSAANRSPFPLHLLRYAAAAGSGIDVAAFDQSLAAGASVQLPVADPKAVEAVVVQRALDLPDPLHRPDLFTYVDVHTETVQEARYSFGVNATAIDFTAAGLSRLDLALSLDELPALSIPGIALTPAHRVDATQVLVPLQAAITGLAATVTITATAADASHTWQRELATDFLDHPILVLSPAAVAAP